MAISSFIGPKTSGKQGRLMPVFPFNLVGFLPLDSNQFQRHFSEYLESLSPSINLLWNIPSFDGGLALPSWRWEKAMQKILEEAQKPEANGYFGNSLSGRWNTTVSIII